MLKPVVESLNLRVLRESQHVATIDPCQAGGADNEPEAERPHAP